MDILPAFMHNCVFYIFFVSVSGAQPDISANNASTATTNSTSSASGRNSTSSTTANSTLAQTSQAGTGKLCNYDFYYTDTDTDLF